MSVGGTASIVVLLWLGLLLNGVVHDVVPTVSGGHEIHDGDSFSSISFTPPTPSKLVSLLHLAVDGASVLPLVFLCGAMFPQYGLAVFVSGYLAS